MNKVLVAVGARVRLVGIDDWPTIIETDTYSVCIGNDRMIDKNIFQNSKIAVLSRLKSFFLILNTEIRIKIVYKEKTGTQLLD